MKNYSKSTVLLVDDNPANILALERLLETSDRVFLKASSGDEALKLALNREVDLIILDVQMPAMDGFEVSQILKSNGRTRDIPIIFASAEKKDHYFMMKGFEEGAVDYLSKPLDPDLTRAKVSVLLKLQMQKRELTEKNLSLERSALLINNSADIIGIIDEVSLKFEEINQAFTTILGHDPKEVKGTSLEFFLSDEDRSYIKNLRTKNKERMSFETRIYCKDRSIRWLQWNVVIKDGKWFVNARDITLVKQVQKVRDYLAAIVKQSNDAIYIHDDVGKIISWNKGAEDIYGYTEEEALRMKIWNIIPDHLQSDAQHIIDEVKKGKGLNAIESRRITKHGKLVDVLFSASVIKDPENDKRSVAITERNITLQKKADEQIKQLNSDLQAKITELEESNKELESFSYTISHDLRAPLRAISGYSRVLEEDYIDKLDDEAKRMLASIERNASKMGNLIDDLLAFSRMGKKDVAKTRIDMTEVVHGIIDELRRTVPCSAEFAISELLPVPADPALINQVWVNLLSNAVKYSGKRTKPNIQVGSYAENGDVVFYVRDNGTGFDMEYANKLFGVFQRLHRADEFEGTGIGLAIVHRVVTRHQGKVWAEGKLNEGATFYFSLPAE